MLLGQAHRMLRRCEQVSFSASGSTTFDHIRRRTAGGRKTMAHMAATIKL
ncbi:hypothetical protein [Bifidobacterium animalis]|nr:hypothetical protein [Bifidobacterium animalis]